MKLELKDLLFVPVQQNVSKKNYFPKNYFYKAADKRKVMIKYNIKPCSVKFFK